MIGPNFRLRLSQELHSLLLLAGTHSSGRTVRWFFSMISSLSFTHVVTTGYTALSHPVPFSFLAQCSNINAMASNSGADEATGYAQLDATSMKIALRICSQLGYDDSATNAPSRGASCVLLDETIALVKSHPDIREPEAYTDMYLGQPPVGLRHNYFVWNGALPSTHLTWEKDSEK